MWADVRNGGSGKDLSWTWRDLQKLGRWPRGAAGALGCGEECKERALQQRLGGSNEWVLRIFSVVGVGWLGWGLRLHRERYRE